MRSNKKLNIVVTTGGVKEKIDSVRNITNSSSGKLGMKIVNEFLSECPNCNIFCIHGDMVETFTDYRVKYIRVRSTQDLLNVVTDVLTNNKIDIFVHSMAVADYTTSYVLDIVKLKELISAKNFDNVDELIESCKIDNSSKISSYLDSLAIVLEKTPKVIHAIKELSPYTFLVGFKLLDSVSDEELFDAGFDLLRKNRCNLVLANDIAKIRQGNYRGLLIYPEKSYDVVEGKDNIAKFLVEKILSRESVRHPKSIQDSVDSKIPNDIFKEFYKTGKYLDRHNFLPLVINHERTDKVGTYGNLSMKAENGFYITSRNVNKRELKKEDISYISKVDMIPEGSVYSNVHYNSPLKPSIDTTIHSGIYSISGFTHIIHIHTDKEFDGIPLINEMFPCGCDMECNAILDVIKRDKNVDIIQMKKHGLIILGNSFEECQEKLMKLFEE